MKPTSGKTGSRFFIGGGLSSPAARKDMLIISDKYRFWPTKSRNPKVPAFYENTYSINIHYKMPLHHLHRLQKNKPLPMYSMLPNLH